MGKILLIIPYEFYPPRYGGALRCFYLMREMARYHDVTLLTVQPLSDFSTPVFPLFPVNVKLSSTANSDGYKTVLNIFPSRLANFLNSKILYRSFFERGSLYLLKSYPILKRLLKENDFDFVCYENLECFATFYNQIKRISPATKHIYDAHNVDSELWKQQAKSLNMPELLHYAAGTLNREKQLYKEVALCFCCSNEDREKFMQLNKGNLNAIVVPNGVDVTSRPFDENPEKHTIKNILFCGTLDYSPNIEGILWFYEKIFPIVKVRIPQINLTVIGKMHREGPFGALREDVSVNFVGHVDDVVESYRNSSVAIVPLLNGSGTRLKILEAMSLGNPVVSTRKGAEGLKYINGKHLLTADNPNDFANAIVELLENKSRFEQIRCHAKELVENEYDWKSIGHLVQNAVLSIL